MSDTIFNKIIHKEVPATIVYEDEQFLAFLDISPVAKGHTLLIPKKSYRWIHDAPDELVGTIFVKAKEVILAMQSGLGCDYVQLVVIGSEVPHFHIHLIPRYLSEPVKISSRPEMPYESEAESTEYAEKIKNSLNKKGPR